MKVAIYCRVSTEGQELNQQIEACKKYCEFKQFTYELFSDIGSGKNMNRQNFQLMLHKIRLREYQGLVVFRFDRIGRNAREVVTLFEEFENKGVNIYSLNENIDTSNPVGKAVRDIIVRLAQLERENISEATKQRLQALKNLGKTLGRPTGSKDKKTRRKSGYHLRYANKGESKIQQEKRLENKITN